MAIIKFTPNTIQKVKGSFYLNKRNLFLISSPDLGFTVTKYMFDRS